MARLAAVLVLALVAAGCSGEGSEATGDLVVARESSAYIVDVYVVDLASGEERRIGSDATYGGSWSPSGTKVASADGDTAVITTVATGARKRYPARWCALPVWAPDETMFACEYNEPWVVSTLDLVTGKLRTVTRPSVVSVAPAWSPDSRSIVYYSYNGLIVMARDGSDKHRVATPAFEQEDGPPQWSPDGQRIAYISENSLWVVDADGSNERRLVDGEGRAMKQLAWSPDGRSIAVAHGDGDFEIFVVDAASGEARKVTDNTGINDRQPVWSPDGRHLAFVSWKGMRYWVSVVPTDSGTPTRVADGNAILHWSVAEETR